MLGINKHLGNRSREKGFTLVEMAIVLVIIGLIIAAVSIGKDAQRNAEYKKIINKFVFGWKSAYNQYYERNGYVLGDNKVAGTISGQVGNGTVLAAPVDADTDANIVPTITASGIIVPESTDATGKHKAQYNYWDQAGVPHNLQLGFKYSGTAGNTHGENNLLGNMMIMSDVTPRLATMMDSIIDGKTEYNMGTFRCGSNFIDTAQDAKSVNTDTAEVKLSCAWKMDQ